MVVVIDAPWAGVPTRIRRFKRRWMCRERTCQTVTFLEHDERVCAPRARLGVRAIRWAGRVQLSVYPSFCLKGLMNDDDVVVSGASGRETVEELRRSGALDALFERLDAGEVEMTGSQGLLPALLKEALERGLAAELSEHLGYEKGQASGQARSNTRNGTTKKTVISEVGAFEIEVPRDRAGSFTPRLVRKGQRCLDGLDAIIISLYAGG